MAGTIMPAGLTDPAFDSQGIFRAVLNAFSHPGTVRTVHLKEHPPAPLMVGTAAFGLTLFDMSTPLWVDPTLESAGARDYLGFHTGCAWAKDAGSAAFVILDAMAGVSDFSGFSQGTLEYPDRSATLICQVDGLSGGEGTRLTGPGIEVENRLAVHGVASSFWDALERNRRAFPLGVDVVLIAKNRIACLPRTTKAEVRYVRCRQRWRACH